MIDRLRFVSSRKISDESEKDLCREYYGNSIIGKIVTENRENEGISCFA